MGIVAMGRGGTLKFKGAYSTELIGCIYCDLCGSFKISRCITPKNLVGLLAAAIIPLLLWNSTEHPLIMSLICFFWLSLFILHPFGVMKLGYKCKKCKNKNITFSNVLGYAESDRSILDVPFKVTKKQYQWDY